MARATRRGAVGAFLERVERRSHRGSQRRHRAEQQRRDERQRRGEQQHARVEADRFGARQRGAGVGEQHTRPPEREQQTKSPAEQGEHETFSEQLARHAGFLWDAGSIFPVQDSSGPASRLVLNPGLSPGG